MEKDQKIGEEELTPILSRLAVMLHMRTTIRIQTLPLSLKIALMGSSKPALIFEIFKIYEPVNTIKTPKIPIPESSSPNITFDVKRSITGEKLSMGRDRDNGETFMAEKYK
jgi:hypothetical protein